MKSIFSLLDDDDNDDDDNDFFLLAYNVPNSKPNQIVLNGHK